MFDQLIIFLINIPSHNAHGLLFCAFQQLLLHFPYDLVCFWSAFGVLLVPDKFQEIKYLSFYSDVTAYRDWLGVCAKSTWFCNPDPRGMSVFITMIYIL